MMFKKKRKLSVDIPTASMGDIVFLLLIFFMVTTVFNNEMGLQIVLPEDSKEEIKVKSETIVKVRIDRFGNVKASYFVDGTEITEPVEWRNVSDKTMEILEKDVEEKLIFSIIPTRLAKYEYMIRVFDQLKIAFEKSGRTERISLSPAEDDED